MGKNDSMSMKGSMSMPKTGGVLHEGLKTNSPKSCDSSTQLKGMSVNEGAVRTGTAKTPPTIGPRTA